MYGCNLYRDEEPKAALGKTGASMYAKARKSAHRRCIGTLGDEETALISLSVSVDVPELVEGVRFYTNAFGFYKVSEPIPGIAVLRVGTSELCLLEKAPGSKPSSHTMERRHYERHWTPVHIDLHVDDLKAALTRAIEAGAKQEQLFENPEHGSVAFCSDPFGHGFCLIERKKK